MDLREGALRVKSEMLLQRRNQNQSRSQTQNLNLSSASVAYSMDLREEGLRARSEMLLLNQNQNCGIVLCWGQTWWVEVGELERLLYG
jgi:hypothetical protein